MEWNPKTHRNTSIEISKEVHHPNPWILSLISFITLRSLVMAHGMKAQNIPERRRHLNWDIKSCAQFNSLIVSPTNFRRLPKETAPRFGTWNESPKHTQKLTTPQSIWRKRCTIQLQEIDLRQFSSPFLPNYPSHLAHGMKAQNIPEKPTTLQSRCQNRCQIQLHEFLSNLKKCPQTCPKRRACVSPPIDYSLLINIVPEASSDSFTFWWWLL